MVVGVAGNLGRKLASLRFASADVDLEFQFILHREELPCVALARAWNATHL